MEVNVLLSKCITLLYRESQLEKNTDNSVDMVRTALDEIRPSEVQIGTTAGQKDVVESLKDLVLEMCSSGPQNGYDETELLQQIRLIVGADDVLYNAIAKSIEGEPEVAVIKRTVTNIRKNLTNYFKDQKVNKIITKAYRDVTFQRHNIRDRTEYFQNMIAELEVNLTPTTSKDPAIIYSLDISDDNSMSEVYNTVQDSNSDAMVYRFGDQDLNAALQGGARPGDTMVIGALQHNYKTSKSLSLFADLALYNRPKTQDKNKKPLLYRATFEDSVRNNAQMLYLYLKHNETGEWVDYRKVSYQDMAAYVKQRLQVNGWRILIEEIDPSNWTYRSMINRIVELESQGYKVEGMSLDYLAKMSKEGCHAGSTGDDMLDLLGKMRNFCAANGIFLMTPHQLSTEAKRRLETVPAEQFLNVIKGGGFFEYTKGLDRIYDIGLLIHKIETPNGDYLHNVIDKHRFPTVVDSALKSWYQIFPANKMPIRANILDENHKPLRKIPRHFTATPNRDDTLFL